MGRQRKTYTEKFKIDAVREALKNGVKREEIAIKNNIAQSTLSEWIEMFIEGKILTEEQKALEERIAELEKQLFKSSNGNRYNIYQNILGNDVFYSGN